MYPGSSSGRTPAHEAGDLGSNLGPGVNFLLIYKLKELMSFNEKFLGVWK